MTWECPLGRDELGVASRKLSVVTQRRSDDIRNKIQSFGIHRALPGTGPMHRQRVRAVVTTQYGCSERSDWYPDESPQVIAAMEALVKKQTGVFSVSWEYWDDASDGVDSTGEVQ